MNQVVARFRLLRVRLIRHLPRTARSAARVTMACACLAMLLGAGRTWLHGDRTAMRREIRMRGNSFAPRDVRVAVGDTVVWVNGDIVRHNAVRPNLFDSGELKAGERFAWIPEDTGTVQYRCTIHSRMRGTIVVRKAR